MNQKILKNLENQLKLENVIVLINSVANGVFIYKCDYQGGKALLKITPFSDQEKLFKQKKEVSVSEIISDFNSQNPQNQISFLKVLKSGVEEEHFWMLRVFEEGDSLSGTSELEAIVPLRGYDYVKKNYLGGKDDFIKAIFENLKSLQSIDCNLFGQIKTWPKRFKSDFSDLNFTLAEQNLGISLKKTLNFYNEIKDDYFDNNNIKICVGDLNPANVIINHQNKVILTDFEYFCLDNYTLDLAFLWLYLWRYPDWQTELEKYIEPADEDYFRASIIRIVLPFYFKSFGTAKYETGQDQSKDLYLKHIWLEILATVGESYKKLINIKRMG